MESRKTMSNTKSGHIYVISEKEHQSGKNSDLVKIGKVGDPRTPEERLREHQTGNPRQLAIAARYECVDVSHAEALVHSRSAGSRVNGEWFRTDCGDLANSFRDSIELAVRESDRIAKLTAQTDDLKRQKSDGKLRKAKDAELEKKAELDDYELNIRSLQTAQKKIEIELGVLAISASGIEGVANWGIGKPSKKYLHSKLEGADPSLYTQLTETSISGIFRLKSLDKTSLEKPPKLVYPKNLEELIQSNEQADRDGRSTHLHLEHLENHAALSQIKTIRDQLRLELMIMVGDSDGVAEVAKWIREEKDHPIRDAGKIVSARSEELFFKCQTTTSPSSSFHVNPFRPYAFDLSRLIGERQKALSGKG
jgi:hypothetical protein